MGIHKKNKKALLLAIKKLKTKENEQNIKTEHTNGGTDNPS